MPIARRESSGSRVIAHVDMDCFYVQVEQRKQPHLRGQPTAVVQYNSWKGGGLIAVGYEARKDGVKRSMRGDEAKQVCPDIQLVQVPVARGKADLSIYRNAGSEVVSILSRKSRCERASIDEVYLDLTDAAEAMLAETPPESIESINEEALKSHVLGLNEDGGDLIEKVREWFHNSNADHRDRLLACGAIIVAELRLQVLKETEFTCSAGIAHNKMLAKLASGMNKPAQQTVVTSASVQGLLEPLPVKKMKQLGGKLGTSLQDDLGVNTVGELLQFSEQKLQEHYGTNTGTWLWNIARGISGEEVKGRLLPESHGSGKTFPGLRALKTVESVEHWLNELCEELSERIQFDLDQNKRIARTLTLHARAIKPGDTESKKKFPSRSCPLRYGAAKIQEDALNLFHSGLRDYIGSQNTQARGRQQFSWAVTSLSVIANKIVAIPSGTSSIMKYFQSQDQLCSSKQGSERFFPEATSSLPSGTETSGLDWTEQPVDFDEEDLSMGRDILNCDGQKRKSEECATEVKTESMRSTDDQDIPLSFTKLTQDGIKEETSATPISGGESGFGLNQDQLNRVYHGEEAGNKFLIPNIRPQEQKRKLRNDKGASSILRFFRNNSNNSSSRVKLGHDTATDEARPSSSSFQPMSNSSKLIDSEQPKETLLLQAGRESNDSTLGQHELSGNAWDYNIDEIDHNVVNELPPEIRNEVQAWLHPQKRPNIPKRGSSIAHYFLPSKNT